MVVCRRRNLLIMDVSFSASTRRWMEIAKADWIDEKSSASVLQTTIRVHRACVVRLQQLGRSRGFKLAVEAHFKQRHFQPPGLNAPVGVALSTSKFWNALACSLHEPAVRPEPDVTRSLRTCERLSACGAQASSSVAELVPDRTPYRHATSPIGCRPIVARWQRRR